MFHASAHLNFFITEAEVLKLLGRTIYVLLVMLYRYPSSWCVVDLFDITENVHGIIYYFMMEIFL